MSMFPHTVTLYNTDEEDPVTFARINRITILRGVFYSSAQAINANRSDLRNADSASLIIPFSVEAVDGATGEPQTYLPPRAYEAAADKDKHWTVKPSDCFFVKGEVIRPGMSFQEINASADFVHSVTKVDEKDFGNLKHWTVGGA